jgi:hypothetical protein
MPTFCGSITRSVSRILLSIVPVLLPITGGSFLILSLGYVLIKLSQKLSEICFLNTAQSVKCLVC